MSYLIRCYKGVSVSYIPHLDGGGMGFGQDYVPLVKHLFGRVDRVFEFCAGPGFIGFSLLAHGLCRSLCLSDINPEAVAAARHTVRCNGLEDIVSVYESDVLDQIPKTEMWDLVVSNPPHFKKQYEGSIRHHDPDWIIHRKFYGGLKEHLKPGGAVLIQENFEGSEETDFIGMIKSGGFTYEGAFMWADRKRKDYLDTYYFILSRRVEDRDVSWKFPKDLLIDCNTPAPVLDIGLSEDGISEVRLQPFRRYRFRLCNRLGRDVVLFSFKLKFGRVPRFLRAFGNSSASSHGPSFPFHFYPGRYALKDERTRQTLVRIVAG